MKTFLLIASVSVFAVSCSREDNQSDSGDTQSVAPKILAAPSHYTLGVPAPLIPGVFQRRIRKISVKVLPGLAHRISQVFGIGNEGFELGNLKLKCKSISECHVEMNEATESEFVFDDYYGVDTVEFKATHDVIDREKCGKLVEISKKPQFSTNSNDEKYLEFLPNSATSKTADFGKTASYLRPEEDAAFMGVSPGRFGALEPVYAYNPEMRGTAKLLELKSAQFIFNPDYVDDCMITFFETYKVKILN